jgi:hypothetical protein
MFAPRDYSAFSAVVTAAFKTQQSLIWSVEWNREGGFNLICHVEMKGGDEYTTDSQFITA